MATARLASAGCSSPRLDAELLLGFVLGVDRAGLVVRGRDSISGSLLSRFWELVARREAREPVAYILGQRSFRRITLRVDRRVLIPRPETELLVEVGLGLPAGARVVDVGTGSGAVALALKDERPDLVVAGPDVSADAVAVARGNATSLGLDVAFQHGDLLCGGSYDAVLANLPYVSEGESGLAPEITLFEPASALFGGVDGLDVVRRLVGTLDSGVSLVALEIGFGQADAVAELVVGAGFTRVQRLPDLAGIERVVVGHR